MRRSFTSRIGLVVAIASAAAMAVGVRALASNLSHRNIDMVRLVGRVSGIDAVTYKGHECRVETIADDKEAAQTLRLHWRGQTVDFPVWTEPSDGSFLEPYKDWFGVMVLADGAEGEQEFQDNWKGEGGPKTRLVAIARYPAEGFDPHSWGLVRRKEWHYRLALLHTDGPDDSAIEQWDKTYEQLDAIFLPGKYTNQHYVPKTEAERHDKLWMFYAMLEVTPPMQYRGRDKGSEAILASMGWAWPVSAAGSMGVLIGIALFASGGIGRTRLS